MDHDNSQAIELDIKDILLFALRKTHIVLIAGVVVAIAACGYAYYKSIKTSSAASIESVVLNTDVQMAGESDVEYSNRIQLVNRAHTIMENIESMNSQSGYLRNYIENSLLMQLDPMSVAVSEAQFVIKLADSDSVGLDSALIDSYISIIRRGDYIDEIAAEYGYDAGALQEMISATGNTVDNNLILAADSAPTRVLTITVWGASEDLSTALLEGAIGEINNKYTDVNSSLAKHSLTEIGRQNYVSFVLNVRESQLKTMTTYQTLQSQIDYGNRYLDDIAKQLGLTDRNSFYADTTLVVADNGATSRCVKYAVIGFVLGALLVAGFLACKYIWGGTIVTQNQFFKLFPGCENIGILKPSGKRNCFIKNIDRFSGDDTELSVDTMSAIVAANYENLTRGTKRVLVTGTIENETVKQTIQEMGIKADIHFDIFNHPELLRTLSDYDGVVIVEKRGVSTKKKVEKELNLLQNGTNNIVGAIIL